MESESTRMLELLNSFLAVQALHVAAALGIPDRLAAGSATAEELGEAVRAHPPSLHRLLRMLTGVGVVRAEAPDRFALTPLGETLRSDVPHSVRDWALHVGEPELWRVWSGLLETVRTGEAAFPRAHGATLWAYASEHPEVGEPFQRWMSRQSAQHNEALVGSYDFRGSRTVVDVGGGRGATLAAILTANPHLRGVLLDLPAVVADTAPLRAAGVADRCEVVAGDMLEGVPPAGDVYLAKRVLMDWSDEQASEILRRCAEAMAGGGRVLAVEMVVEPGDGPSPAKTFDLLMLLMHSGGRIRTEPELRELFATAGLRVARVIPTPSPNRIVEGVRT